MLYLKDHKKFVIKPSSMASAVLALFISGFGLLISTYARAQVAGATVSGTLSDASGAVIPNAHVVISNIATGISTTVTANAGGFYTAPNLIAGSYEMKVTAPGFGTEVRTGILLEVGAQVVQNVRLNVGQDIEKVEVTGAAPDVQLASSSIGAVVGREAVVELPLNGRSWTDLATLQPGVVGLTTQNILDSLKDAAQRANQGYGKQTAINGARPSMNNYRLDGITVNDYANGAPSNTSGETSGVDSIQEFSVLTSNFSAEYGNVAGGVINAVTRSGENRLHGSLYEFVRNDKLDARNYFDPAQIPAFRRNQFGASIGGPIIKDRTFFFANYEGLRQLQSITDVNIVPSAAARAGTICSNPTLVLATSPCTTTTIKVDPAAAVYLGFFPLPNAGLLPTGHGDTGYYNFVSPQTANYNLLTTRIDHHFSDKDRISGVYAIDRGPFTTPDNLDNVVLGFVDNFQTLSIEETHVFNSTFVNAARVGALRSFGSSNQTVGVVNPLANDLNICDAASTPACGLKISGIASSTGGAGGYSYTTRSFTTPQFFDDASKILGNHSVKFGIAVERQEFNLNQIPPAGSWAFGSLVNFLTNVPTSYQPPTIVAVTHEWGMRDTVLGGYVQDDWRLHPNLTLNIGLRYEMLTNPTEVHGNFASLTSVTGDASAVRRGNPLYPNNSTLHDVSPRVGFAYDPFGDGKTSIRAGYGVFDVLPMIYQWAHEIIGVYPFEYAALDSKPAAGSFYNGITPSQLSTSSYTVMYIQPNMKRSYVQQWNLTMQREVAPNLTATVSYVGSVGTHLSYRTVDSNGIDPTLTSAGYLYPHPILSTNPIINPNFGEIQGTYYIGNSSYNALQVMVNKRMSHGFQIQGSYTWGRSIDDTSSQVAQFDSQTALETPLNPAFIPPSRYRGPSDFNTDQTFVANGIWQVPEARLRSRFAGRIVNGWQLGGIYKAAGGEPFTPTFGNGGNVTGANSLANTDPGFPDRLSGPGCGSATHPQKANNYINLNCFSLPTAPNMAYWTANCDHTSKIYGSTKTTEPYPICFNLMGNAARNSINGPGLSELDFSAFKNNKIGERYNLQFRAEIFNILNRVNFADPPNTTDTDLYTSNGVASGSAGVLTTTATSSRQIQFALKLTW